MWRKAPDYKGDLMSCHHCKEIFNKENKRGRPICRFHSGTSSVLYNLPDPHEPLLTASFFDGKLLVDEHGAYWDDFDEETKGPIDTEQTIYDFPDGFKWDCWLPEAPPPRGSAVLA